MSIRLFQAIALMGLFAGSLAFGLDFGNSGKSDEKKEDLIEDAAEGRFFFLLANQGGGNAINLNATLLAALTAALASAFMGLLNMAGLGLLLAEQLDDEEKVYHLHHDSGYSSYRR